MAVIRCSAHRWAFGLVCAGLFGLAVPTTAEATVVVRLTREAMVQEADVIVHARVVDRAVVPYRGPNGQIYTRTTLQVQRWLKGTGQSRLTVQQIGGTLGDLTMHFEGNARLEPGDEVVAFLTVDRDLSLAYVVGLAQGVFRVDRSGRTPRVTRDLSGLAFYDYSAQARPRIANGRVEAAERLSALLDDVARIVREQARSSGSGASR